MQLGWWRRGGMHIECTGIKPYETYRWKGEFSERKTLKWVLGKSVVSVGVALGVGSCMMMWFGVVELSGPATVIVSPRRVSTNISSRLAKLAGIKRAAGTLNDGEEWGIRMTECVNSKKSSECCAINLLKTKNGLLYLKTHFVPRSKHFSSRL